MPGKLKTVLSSQNEVINPLNNLSVYMFNELLNVSLLKYTISPTLKEPALQNDIQLNRLKMKTGRHFEIQDGGRHRTFLTWH